MNEQAQNLASPSSSTTRSTSTKHIGLVVLLTVTLLLALGLGLKGLTAQAEKLQNPENIISELTIVKTASHESAARGTTITFTIDVHNNSTTLSTVDGLDQIPPEMETPTIIAADDNVTYTIQAGELSFTIKELEPGQGSRLVYRTRINLEAECGKELVNQAQLTQNNEPIGTPTEARVHVICSDLGDAPTSDNHFSTDMHTLWGVVARYPTVYYPPSGAPSGPRHHRADLMHLGSDVSFERQADVGPDDDPTNNILPPADAADLDRFDDGLQNISRLDFAHCQITTLELQVYMDPAIVQMLDRAFINVWLDGNRDGDWDDVNPCDLPDTPHVPEHIVIDYPVGVAAGYQTISVQTTVPVFNPTPDDPTWLRVTLSEQRSVKIGNVGPWDYGDGRGVLSTLVNPDTGEEVAGFKLGETEDYFLRPSVPGQPGLVIAKEASQTQANLGDMLIYEIQVTNTHPITRLVTIVDPIPPGTTYISGSFHSNPPGTAEGYDASRDAIFWRGELPAGKSVTVWFTVRVIRCDPNGFRVVNHAWAFEPGLPPVEAQTVTFVNECIPPARRIWVGKRAPLEVFPNSDVDLTLVAHNATLEDIQINVMDPLPLALSVDPASLPPDITFLPPNVVLWQPAVAAGETVSVTFPAHVRGWACREGVIRNQAYWWTPNTGLDGHSNSTWTDVICSDLGDAPDSTYNHHGITNTAYSLAGTVVITPLVKGLYPTVWQADYPPDEPTGPRHLDASKAWLGNKVSYEREADIGPDADGLNNILALGKDNADNDRFDDGWLNPDVPLPHCRETTLQVRIHRGHYAAERMWLNVWFDGNRDGDWEDVTLCGTDQHHAFEWIVQNFAVDMSTWPVGTYRNYLIRTRPILNETPKEKGWMRFTLSETPAPRNPNTGLADGRGPDYKHFYRWGETEDYQAPGVPTGTPGEVSVDKTASVLTATLGQVYTYSVYLTHSADGTAPAYAVMTDVLPAEVKLASGPTVTELHPTATPLIAYFDSHVGPSGAVGWRGWLSPGAAIRVDFPVKVRHCPADVRVIQNVAIVHQLGATSVVSASVETPVDCTPPPKPNIELHKRIVTDLNEHLTEWTTVPGRHVVYRLVLSGTNAITYPVRINDPMQGGVIAIAADASSGIAHVIQGGRAVVWEGEIGPAINQVVIRIRVKLRNVYCKGIVKNVAYWYTLFDSGQSNIAWLKLACHDLGDAPDSSNHFDVDMRAYPSVTATFPTVYTATTPLLPFGPLHVRPQPIHLGPRVSFEIEADLGVDLDGINNIEPRLDKANLDKVDDGLEPDKLWFTHCEYKRIPVWISIHPAVYAMLNQEREAYLNIWLDSNRDGDWNDAFECPPAAGGDDPITAPEHIVVDHSISPATLGPGLHRIWVTTDGPVPWPAGMTDPAWLRVTLSERESNKTLPAGCAGAGCAYGDGRGYADPFALGETEDYLVRGPEKADPTVKKRGFIHPFFRFERLIENGRMIWAIGWPVHYRNTGGTAATGVQVIDTLSEGQALMNVRSYPHITPTISGPTLTFTVGTLTPGKTGHIFIHTHAPFTTTPGTVLTNTVIITSDNDSDLSNNNQVVTVTVPLLPPLITDPRPGTTCTGLFTITGRTQMPGTVVELFINHVSITTATADAQGHWLYPVNLADGTYKIQAQANYGGLTSPLSPPVKVTVDSSLVWDPLSLHFISANGHVVFPKDTDGYAAENGWFVFLRPGQTYTVTVRSCCDDPNASFTLELPDGQVVNLEDADNDGWYEGTFVMPNSGGPIRLCVVCYNVEYCSEGQVLIDPEGVVFDVTQGEDTGLLDEAVVACYEHQTDIESEQTSRSLWPAESYGQVNPQTTDTDGYFSFFTPAGVYQVDVTRQGYQPYQSWDLVVVDEPVEFNVPLTPDTSGEANETVTVDESGFNPAVLTVDAGAIIEWVNVGDEPHTTTSLTPTARITPTVHIAGLLDLDHTDGWDSGLLESGESYKRQLNTAGTYYYHDHENSSYTGLIIVQGAHQIYLPIILRDVGG